MRATTALGCLLSVAGCFAADQRETELSRLIESRNWFGLRDAVESATNVSALYRGAVAWAFNNSREAEIDLQLAIQSALDAGQVEEARTLLAYLYMRDGRFSLALAQFEAMQAAKPDPGTKINSAFSASFARYPVQSIARRAPSKVRYTLGDGYLLVPVSIDGHPANFEIDTGAAISVVRESEAKRLGLPIQAAQRDEGDENSWLRKVTVAGQLTIGDFQLRNVAFLVMPDDQSPSDGILGLPVLLAFETLRWDADGDFGLGFPASPQDLRKSNLCLDWDAPVTEAGIFASRPKLKLATGMPTSAVSRRFLDDFGGLVGRLRENEPVQETGEDSVVTAPEFRLQVGGLDTVFHAARVDDGARSHHGRVGMDLLNQARVVTIDFKAMTLTLEGRPPDAELRSLYDAHQWFKLRETVVAAGNSPVFYQGAVAAVFNDYERAEKLLRPLTESAQRPWEADAARDLLADVNGVSGRMQKGALGLKLPDQSVAARGFSRFRKAVNVDGQMVLPVSVNGKNAKFILDTGASVSVMSETEAKRLGLAVRDAVWNPTNAEGLPVQLHIAAADQLVAGNFRLRNVAFGVYRDDVFPGLSGVIGLPVLLAFQTLRWSADGTIEIGFPSTRTREPNLCFEGDRLTAQAGLGERKIRLHLDTGDDATHLAPRFRDEFPTPDAITLQFAGFDTILRGSPMLPERAESAWFHGRLGMDLLSQARTVTIDFQAMMLTLRDRNPQSILISHWEAGEWPMLRDALKTTKASAFYRGAVACAFNDSKNCEKNLQAAIKSAPDSGEAYVARGTLTYLYSLIGRYRQALAQLDEMQKRKPNAEDVKAARSLYAAFSRYPDQSIVRRGYSKIRCETKDGRLFVPVSINDHSASYMLDTGTGLSWLSESEAKRLGLTVLPVKTKSHDWTGAECDLQHIAVAAQLDIGDVRLRNVAFLISPDNEWSPGEQGLLGMPVLAAIETIRWSAGGTLEIAFPSARNSAGKPNLYLDGERLILDTGFRDKRLGLFLDTGEWETILYPKFRDEFAIAIGGSGKKASIPAGSCRPVQLDAIEIAELPLRLGGLDTLLRPAHVLVKRLGYGPRHGLLRMDLLNQARVVTLDLKAMRLTLE